MYLMLREVFVGFYIVFIAWNVHICCAAMFADKQHFSQRETSETPRVQPVQGTKVKEEDWLDPTDMLNTDLSSFKQDNGEKETQPKPRSSSAKAANVDIADSESQLHNFPQNIKMKEHLSETTRQQNCDMPYFKQLTRIVIESFERPGKHYVSFELSKNDLNTLNEFKDKDVDGERIYDIFEIIKGMFSEVQEDERIPFSYWSQFKMNVDYNKEIVAVLVIITVLSFILLLFECRTAMSWTQQFWYFLVGLFLISIPWEWFRLYRIEFAKKQSEMIKEFPTSCIPNKMTIPETISLFMGNLLTWKEDECAKYQEAILVDPVWEVSPSQAFSITATRFFVKPLEYIAEACGKSFKAFFIHVPGQWQPFMFLGIGIMLFLCLFFFTKSRIKFGFFEIGPASQPALRRFHEDDIMALGELIEGQIKKIQGVQGRRDNVPRIAAAVIHDEKLNNPRVVQEIGTKAFSITATRFFVKPLEYIAEACGKSFKAFFIHVPGQWQPFMFLGIGIMLFLCLFFFTKSRIKFGFFEIGPASQPALRRFHEDDMMALGELIERQIQGVQGRRDNVPGIAAAVTHDEKLNNQCVVQEIGTPSFDEPMDEIGERTKT